MNRRTLLGLLGGAALSLAVPRMGLGSDPQDFTINYGTFGLHDRQTAFSLCDMIQAEGSDFDDIKVIEWEQGSEKRYSVAIDVTGTFTDVRDRTNNDEESLAQLIDMHNPEGHDLSFLPSSRYDGRDVYKDGREIVSDLQPVPTRPPTGRVLYTDFRDPEFERQVEQRLTNIRPGGSRHEKITKGIKRGWKYKALIRDTVIAKGLDPEYADLFFALMIQESLGNTRARSRAGAAGLFQIMPGTGKKDLGMTMNQFVDLRYSIRTSIEKGIQYLEKPCLTQAQGDIRIALAGYNGGPYGLGDKIKDFRRRGKSISYNSIMAGRNSENSGYAPGIYAIQAYVTELSLPDENEVDFRKTWEIATITPGSRGLKMRLPDGTEVNFTDRAGTTNLDRLAQSYNAHVKNETGFDMNTSYFNGTIGREFKDMNAHVKKDGTLVSGVPYVIWVPKPDAIQQLTR